MSTEKAALVTGGAKRIGRAVCLALAARGMRVVVHANHSTDEAELLVEQVRAQGGEAVALSADLAEEPAAEGLIDNAHIAFGRLDVLVNSAAIWTPTRLEHVNADDLLQHLRINAVAPFVCAKRAGLIMAAQDSGGAIVNVGDWAHGPDGRPYPDYSAYHLSKSAIPVLTRNLAIELARRNGRVRVNAVLPGPVLASPGEDENNRPTVFDGNLLSVPGTAEDVAEAVAFLATSPFITGVCLPVDGGRRLC